MKTHSVNLTDANLRKMQKGEPTLLKHEQIMGGDITLHLHPAKHRKIQTALRKKKGLKLTMTPEEWENTLGQNEEIIGGRIRLKDIGRAFKKGYDFYKRKIKPIVGEPIRKALKAAVKTAIPAAVGFVAGPEAVPAATALTNQFGDQAVDALGRATGAFGLKKHVILETSGSNFLNMAHPSMQPRNPYSDHSVRGKGIRHKSSLHNIGTPRYPRLPMADHSGQIVGGSFRAAGRTY